jgi:uncharacterized phage protein (TIGR01671 family)
MRTIKFRAWDAETKTMIEVDRWHVYELDDPSANIMQFTGLKDKEGKEIYEGDIVVLGGKYPKNKVPQLIGYDAGYLSYGIVYDTGEMMRKLTPLEIVKGIEIVGNIYQDGHLLTDYENPDLLK